ncbi:PTS transporter subunit EIIC [Butyrivibrio sp. FCS014]|uniref:PTS transporter subunit EIIC n=1 Tax=Butyrivibrio sp. FCS014 TaxID=1408304 RepID=UPI002E8E0C0F|nr:PTS transporter subunit EIIC [Butyrivibrio sp. FCS014]
MGAMIAGPLAGWVIKKFDKAVEGKIPSGFEMLVNNFSVGILGLLLAILGYYVIGPFMGGVLAFLNAGVAVLVNNNILPLVSVFVEPAKVLFLNNAINHGIFTPLGAEQVAFSRQVNLLHDRDKPRRRYRCASCILAVL